MSKIAEQKALETYPIDIIPDDDTMGFTSSDRNEVIRLGYIKGYDTAFQDFLKKASKYLFDNLPHTWDITQTVSFIDNFEIYMQNESEN